MNNYKLIVEYDGTEFDGWQNQKGRNNTIQGHLERSLKLLLKSDIKITGAGRTDAGVHALNQVCNFLYQDEINERKILNSINALIPPAITVKSIDNAGRDFHARYSARAREYDYKLTLRRRSVERIYYHFLKYKIDFDFIDEAINFLSGEHSFKSICKNKEDKREFKCNIFVLRYKYFPRDQSLIFTVKANRFLHSMVRALIGLLVDIGRGKISINEFKNKFNKGEKIKSTYLPPNGLFLKKIYY